MLPGLFVLKDVLPVGYLRKTVPPTLTCSGCRAQVGSYEKLEVVLERWPECDIVTAEGSYFVSERLLHKLIDMGATDFIHKRISMTTNDDFRLRYPWVQGLPSEIPPYSYLSITGRCDGPWQFNAKDGVCLECGHMRAKTLDFAGTVDRILGRVQAPPKLVDPNTWHGEDFFTLTESSNPIITKRIADLLIEMEDCQAKEAEDKEEVRRKAPMYAKLLEVRGWQTWRCVSFERAGWVAWA